MKIVRTMVEKIRIEDINLTHRLDPVEVIIENYPQEGTGKIIITCYGESWTGFWGSMGGTVQEFFQRVSNDYLIDKISDLASTVEDPDQDTDFLKKLVLTERRQGNINKVAARHAWWYLEAFTPDRHRLIEGGTPEHLRGIEGLDEPWYLDWPKAPNPKYEYLERILDVVREVIKPEVKDDK